MLLGLRTLVRVVYAMYFKLCIRFYFVFSVFGYNTSSLTMCFAGHMTEQDHLVAAGLEDAPVQRSAQVCYGYLLIGSLWVCSVQCTAHY